MESGSAIVPASLAGINAESDSTAFVNLEGYVRSPARAFGGESGDLT